MRKLWLSHDRGGGAERDERERAFLESRERLNGAHLGLFHALVSVGGQSQVAFGLRLWPLSIKCLIF